MALTDRSDLFASVSEGAVNRVLHHIRRRRPSLFAYGTAWVAENWRERLCRPPDVAPEVLRHGNPVVTVEKPLPIVGTGGVYGLDFSAQLTELTLDLSPQTVALPPELGALGDQRFSIEVELCVGMGVPDERTLEQFPPAPYPPLSFDPGVIGKEMSPEERAAREEERRRAEEEAARLEAEWKGRGPVVLPTDKLRCCCLKLFAVGHLEVTAAGVLEAKLDGLEIVDIGPECLEADIEQYLWLLMHYVVLPRLRVVLPVVVFHILDGVPNITVRPTTTVPHNPSIEDDQVKVYADVEVGP
jgi:hypothetical protein